MGTPERHGESGEPALTVIAWDGKTLAGDRMRQVYFTPTPARKVWRARAKDGRRFLVGAAGEIVDCVAFVRWLKKGTDELKPTPTDFIGLVIDDKRQIWMVDQKLVYFRIREKFWSIGSGADYAIAAMACGRSAADAVRIASRFDSRCGLGVDVVRFG